MGNEIIFILSICILLAAFLYSSVGHAGASGYLAAMALFSLSPEVMKPTALVLNILVASVASVKYYRAGCFSWKIFYPFAFTSIPFAFIGGAIVLPTQSYKIIVGMVLLYSAYKMFIYKESHQTQDIKDLPLITALLSGAFIGLLSGLTGVGGGIFLSPLLLFMGWAETKQTSGISAVFILVNSIAGLLGHISSINNIPFCILFWAVAALIGGWFGSEYGSKRFNNLTIRKCLSLVLLVAGVKMMVI